MTAHRVVAGEDWIRLAVRLEPGTTKNNDGRAFPLIPALRALLERRQAITRRCERAQARITSSVATAGRSGRCDGRGKPRAGRRGGPGSCSTTSGARR